MATIAAAMVTTYRRRPTLRRLMTAKDFPHLRWTGAKRIA
jgi:hypothetical protein